MNIGDYVRTTGDAYEPSKIGKIKEVDITSFKEVCYKIDSCGKHILIPESFIKKTSFNLIDLIEPNDYINGRLIWCVYANRNEIWISNNDRFHKDDLTLIKNEDIKEILTKEQYENNCYRVERK
jgi:hypothetical protein